MDACTDNQVCMTVHRMQSLYLFDANCALCALWCTLVHREHKCTLSTLCAHGAHCAHCAPLSTATMCTLFCTCCTFEHTVHPSSPGNQVCTSVPAAAPHTLTHNSIRLAVDHVGPWLAETSPDSAFCKHKSQVLCWSTVTTMQAHFCMMKGLFWLNFHKNPCFELFHNMTKLLVLNCFTI